jgi:hypothetical protein
MLRRVPALAFAVAGVAAGCSSCSSPEAPAAQHDASDAGADAPDVSIDQDADVPADAAEDIYGSNWDAGLATDPAIWTPVPDNRGCGLYVANVVPDPFPKRVWQSCGTGCEVSDAPMPGLGLDGGTQGLNSVPWGLATASERNGETFYRLCYAAWGGGEIYVVSRLSDGATIAAAQVRNTDCAGFGGANDSALFFPVSTEKNDYSRGGFIQGLEPGAPVVWGNWLPTPAGYGGAFAIDSGWGFSNGNIYLNASPSDAKFQLVYQNTNPYEVYGRGEVIAWHENSRILAWTQAGGAKKLLEIPTNLMWSVALSDQRMVWIVVQNELEGHFTSANLYWSPLATDPADLKASPPIPLPGATWGLVETRVGGDYAATQGCAEWDGGSSCPVWVVQLSTGKVWQVPPRPGGAYRGPLAVSEDVILMGETNYPGQYLDSQMMRRLLRFKTSELDALAKGW